MVLTVDAMAGPVSLELDPIFLKGLSYLHSKSKDSAEKLKALLDESLARGSDSSYRSIQKVRVSKQMYAFSYCASLFCLLVSQYHSLFSGYGGFQGLCVKAELK